jgi:hypothetical protein
MTSNAYGNNEIAAMFSSGTSIGGASFYLPAATYHTVSLVRNGSQWKIYADGNNSGTVTNAIDLGTTGKITVGNQVDATGTGTRLAGVIDEIRITKGIARYTENYTIATEAFPASGVTTAIIGSASIALLPSASLAKHTRGIIGSSSIAVGLSSAMQYTARRHVVGSSSIQVLPMSGMALSGRANIVGTLQVIIAPSATLNKRKYIAGNELISVTPHATLNKRKYIAGNELISVTPHGDSGLNRNRLFCEMVLDFAANGYQEIPNTLTVEMPLPAFAANGGGEFAVGMLPTFAASGYAEIDGTLAVEMPMAFAFSGYTSSDGELAVSMDFTFTAEGGGELAVAMPVFTFEASSVVGSVGEMTVIMPRFEFAASGDTRTSIGTLNVEMPAMYANYGALYVEMAMDFKAWTAPAQNSLVTYAMNVKTAETTTYSNFDFKFIIRLGYDYYGVRDDGLYLLGGETDNGALIEASFRTAQNMYGTNLRKRSPKIYLDTENTTSILPIVDTEEGEYVYESEFDGRKVSLGRGYEGKIWEFELANVDGEAWRIGAMEIQLDVLSRRI